MSFLSQRINSLVPIEVKDLAGINLCADEGQYALRPNSVCPSSTSSPLQMEMDLGYKCDCSGRSSVCRITAECEGRRFDLHLHADYLMVMKTGARPIKARTSFDEIFERLTLFADYITLTVRGCKEDKKTFVSHHELFKYMNQAISLDLVRDLLDRAAPRYTFNYL